MITKQNLIYELVGNSKPRGNFDPQIGRVRYLFRASDIETTGYKNAEAFIDYLYKNILSPDQEFPVVIQYEYMWKDDRNPLICEIYQATVTNVWIYTTYYRQQKHTITFTNLEELINFIKKCGDDHRIINYT